MRASLSITMIDGVSPSMLLATLLRMRVFRSDSGEELTLDEKVQAICERAPELLIRALEEQGAAA